ncbi:MAG: phosphoribosylglycinamide formyltransferase [Pirellulales bacterium]|nr:phosphoribosylglycinamide formyltransferase [Pirellulales bacterium]
MTDARHAAEPLRLAVLISGGGTTLRNLLECIAAGRLNARVVCVVSSSGKAGGLEHARAAGIATHIVERSKDADLASFSEGIFAPCRDAGAQLVVMGGFLKLVEIPRDFEGRVLNIHPSLIPAFCGRGFYGHKVHEAVLAYGCKVSGCTVHFVDNVYDHGPIVLQHTVEVRDDDTPQSLAARVFATECEAYPEAIALYAAGRLKIVGRRVHVAR